MVPPFSTHFLSGPLQLVPLGTTGFLDVPILCTLDILIISLVKITLEKTRYGEGCPSLVAGKLANDEKWTLPCCPCFHPILSHISLKPYIIPSLTLHGSSSHQSLFIPSQKHCALTVPDPMNSISPLPKNSTVRYKQYYIPVCNSTHPLQTVTTIYNSPYQPVHTHLQQLIPAILPVAPREALASFE
jgi:hypothetical protein